MIDDEKLIPHIIATNKKKLTAQCPEVTKVGQRVFYDTEVALSGQKKKNELHGAP